MNLVRENVTQENFYVKHVFISNSQFAIIVFTDTSYILNVFRQIRFFYAPKLGIFSLSVLLLIDFQIPSK